MAIESNFELYPNVSTMILIKISNTQASEDDDDLMEYVNELREGIIEAYIGTIQGIKDGSCVEVLLLYVNTIMGDWIKDYEIITSHWVSMKICIWEIFWFLKVSRIVLARLSETLFFKVRDITKDPRDPYATLCSCLVLTVKERYNMYLNEFACILSNI